MVYAGAILVLYLFVVMLLNAKREDHYHSQWRIAGLVSIPLLIEFIVLLTGGLTNAHPEVGAPGGVTDAVTRDNTLAIGETLFSTYLFPFEVASLILLVAMIGAIILAKKDLLPVAGDQ
jgi:NADH-quinone oxidoreductase subunit J